MKKETTKRVLSLFSGCGGMDLGFEGGFPVLRQSVNPTIHPRWAQTGERTTWVSLPPTPFQTVFANDIREDAKRAWVRYFGGRGADPAVYHLESIVDLVKDYKEGNRQPFPLQVDVVTGGFPCQDFSIAGRRNGFDSQKGHDGKLLDVEAPNVENRGQLYMWMKEVIAITKPKVFVAENVKGLVNLGDVKAIIEQDFSSIGDGYLVVPAKVLHAAEYGVPRIGNGSFFMAFKKVL